MYTRYVNYKKLKKVEPNKIYLEKNGKDYVTLMRFKDMQRRFDTYWKAHNAQPDYVWTVKPATITRGPIQLACEKLLGSFTTFTEFYNKMKNKGYSYYYNDAKTLKQELTTLRNLNCSDATQVGVLLAREMGYTARFCHVQCKTGGHIYGQIRGKEFKDTWIKFDLAAAMSTTSHYSLGNVWCSYAPIESYNDPWLESDDGKT